MLYAVEWKGDECVGLGLNNLADKIHVYFLHRMPVFSKSRHCGLGNELVFISLLPFIQFSGFLLLQKKKGGQQMVTLNAQTEKN